MSILRLSFSALLCLLSWTSPAQVLQPEQPPPDTARTYRPEKPDSLKIKFYPRSVRFGTDLAAIIKSRVVSDFKGWEVNGDLDCGKLYFVVDYGHWERLFDLNNGGVYQNSGNYWRAGMDINLLTKDPDKNMLFFGFRYARSGYNESTVFYVNDPNFGGFQKDLTNPNVTAGWGELVGGLRVKVFSEFWMGYTCRMKFAMKVSGDTAFRSYEIPGYGLNGETFYWGFNYQIFWRIPFRK